MPRKKKESVDINKLDFRAELEDTVLSGRLGRIMASYGAILTAREKQGAKVIYSLLMAERELPVSPTTARISKDKKSKKYSPANVIKWFAQKYPKEAQPLLARLKQEYDRTETSVIYGLKTGRDLPDEQYVQTLVERLQIPKQEAAVMYHGVIKPLLERLKEDEGLVSMVMDKS
jgi:hypothetical protein